MDGSSEEPNPIHQHSEPGVAWTVVNAAENIPGVVTPLGFGFWISGVDVGTHGAFAALGVIPRAEEHGVRPAERWIGGAFFGRFAISMSEFRRLADLTPGGSGSAFEEQIFGHVLSGEPEHTSRRRYPLVALKAPPLIAVLPRLVRQHVQRSRAWWRESTSPTGPAREPRAQLAEALTMMQRAVRTQMLASFVAQGLYDRIGLLAAGIEQPELQLELSTGYGGIEETRMVSALHRMAHGQSSLAEFLQAYGARCPGENDLSARSWRERPEAVQALAGKYRASPTRRDPLDQVDARVDGRVAAERRLLGELAPHRRPAARALLRAARTYIPLREEAKVAMAMAMDTGRFAARNLGRDLVGDGLLDDVEDVFQLTLDEALAEAPGDLRDRVRHRKSLRARYEQLNLPQYWIGDPEPVPVATAATEPTHEVTGIAGASGVAEGRVRVILDPDEIDSVEPDEILVCRTTDPSWASVFQLVSAVVIDIGGTGSHGAIVSREMGLPCVINTGNGTTALRTGDLVRVDGASGSVLVLQPASDSGTDLTESPKVNTP